VVDRGNPARRAVALTFDAGADRGYAEYILDVLKEQGVRATFGMTGVWAERNPDLVQRMAAEGHRLMNHSYDHSSFTGRSTGRRPLTTEERWTQIDRTEQVIVELTGQSTRPLFRAPYGDTDASVLRDIAARGYAYNVLWTVDSRGWMRYSAGAIVERCLRLAEPGAIYVMHVGGESQDALALLAVIEGLRAAGYEFETVDEIIE
jgi:peptidoglycan/xylan/chitin deacetylase (PgdA/CDA1 family)